MDNGSAEKPEDLRNHADSADGKRQRDRSTIDFPYADLDQSIEIARAINDRAGLNCEVVQLASWLNQTPGGGTFRSRLSAARIFGLIETERGAGQVHLTELGRNIIDPSKERAARVDAFLAVPLYALIYERFKGYALPPPAALERQIAEMGVARKQADRARQAFFRSAEQANFLEGESGRLVKPALRNESGKAAVKEPDEREPDGGRKGGGGGEPPKIDPIIQGLIDRLPKPGDVWSVGERKLWLEILENSFKLVYKDAPETKKSEQTMEDLLQ